MTDYRELAIALEKASRDAVSVIAAIAEKKNKPLSLEELTEMALEHQPVWCTTGPNNTWGAVLCMRYRWDGDRYEDVRTPHVCYPLEYDRGGAVTDSVKYLMLSGTDFYREKPEAVENA